MDRYDEARISVHRNLLEPVLELMQASNARVEAAERKALRAEATLEALRPVWAQGWTEDGIAAQASASALGEMWRLLDVSNQTDAMARLRGLLCNS